jgi:hypothetical protein
MNIGKKILASLAIAVASLSASASPINIGGVVWDPDYSSDLQGSIGLINQTAGPNREISGVGVLSFLNGLQASDFCPGCELEIQYGGFTLSAVDGGADPLNDPSGGLTDLFEYTGGWVRFYVDYTPEYISDASFLNSSNTGEEAGKLLWLDLEGAVGTGFETTFVGGAVLNAAAGAGDLNVVGGAAASNFDTDSILLANGGVADITFGSSFSLMTPNGDGTSSSTGSANFSGRTIPEPTSLAIFGLALLAFGVNARKKLM